MVRGDLSRQTKPIAGPGGTSTPTRPTRTDRAKRTQFHLDQEKGKSSMSNKPNFRARGPFHADSAKADPSCKTNPISRREAPSTPTQPKLAYRAKQTQFHGPRAPSVPARSWTADRAKRSQFHDDGRAKSSATKKLGKNRLKTGRAKQGRNALGRGPLSCRHEQGRPAVRNKANSLRTERGPSPLRQRSCDGIVSRGTAPNKPNFMDQGPLPCRHGRGRPIAPNEANFMTIGELSPVPRRSCEGIVSRPATQNKAGMPWAEGPFVPTRAGTARRAKQSQFPEEFQVGSRKWQAKKVWRRVLRVFQLPTSNFPLPTSDEPSASGTPNADGKQSCETKPISSGAAKPAWSTAKGRTAGETSGDARPTRAGEVIYRGLGGRYNPASWSWSHPKVWF